MSIYYHSLLFAGETCHKPLDIILALDNSGRTVPLDWAKIIQFSKTFVDQFDVTNRQTRFGILTFNNYVDIIKTLEEKTSRNEIIHELDKLKDKRLSGMTFTDDALTEAIDLFNRPIAYRDAPKVLIVFFDGKTTLRAGKKDIDFYRKPTHILKTMEATTFAVEFGKYIGEQDIMDIVSEPKLYRIFTLNDLPELVDAVKSLSETACTYTVSM